MWGDGTHALQASVSEALELNPADEWWVSHGLLRHTTIHLKGGARIRGARWMRGQRELLRRRNRSVRVMGHTLTRSHVINMGSMQKSVMNRQRIESH